MDIKTTTTVGAVLLVLSLGMVGSSAVAQETPFDATHPRRAQVNERLERQNARIEHKVATGKMSKAKAAKLHQEDRQIRAEEKAMASQNGGHITKQEQKALNQQENKVSKQIERSH